MSEIVPAEDIEAIVGVRRHDDRHWARAVSDEQTIYVLHSRECLASGIDLRRCRFSLALDNGIRPDEWVENTPLPVVIKGVFAATRLVPDGV